MLPLILLPLLLFPISIFSNVSPPSPHAITRCEVENSVALTFDDGPSVYTKMLLELLRKEKILATFFIVGKSVNNRQSRDILNKTYYDGHLIGSHTFDHLSLVNLTDSEIQTQLEKTEKVIEDVIKVKTRYFRPPFGDIDDRVAHILSKMGYIPVNWNVDTNDWRYFQNDNFDGFEGEFKKNVDLAVQEMEDSIVTLQHDTLEGSVKRTKALIDTLRKAGYTKFMRLDECLKDADPNRIINNLLKTKSSSSGTSLQANSLFAVFLGAILSYLLFFSWTL